MAQQVAKHNAMRPLKVIPDIHRYRRRYWLRGFALGFVIGVALILMLS